MSWNFSVVVESRDEEAVVGEIERRAEDYFGTLVGDGIAEMVEQCQAAAMAAAGMIEAIGTDGPWFIQVGGHANPQHGQRSGWATDGITVVVQEKSK
jgi:hypothetical protein